MPPKPATTNLRAHFRSIASVESGTGSLVTVAHSLRRCVRGISANDMNSKSKTPSNNAGSQVSKSSTQVAADGNRWRREESRAGAPG